MRKTVRLTCGGPDTDFPGFDNDAIQAAVLRAHALGGGEVVLSEGVFNLRDSVHMKTGVRLSGQGRKTVLEKQPMVSDRTAHYMGYGHAEIMVENPEKFSPGDGVYLTGSGCSGGFLATQATVTSVDRESGLLGLSSPLNCDISGHRGGRIRTLFPLIKGDREKDFSVSDLVLDGNADENESIDGCRGGAVFLIGCSSAAVVNVECRNYRRDGISYQQCYDVLVEGCDVHHCSGNGLHPGSGTIRSVIRGCHIHDNGEDGVYYCLRTQYLLLEGNLIENNRRFGVTVGHHDHYTDILNNVIRNNGWEGIFYRTDDVPFGTGNHSVIAGNLLENNGYTSDEERQCEIHIMNSVQGLRVCRNTVRNEGKIAMKLEAPLLDSYIYDNSFEPEVPPRAKNDVPWFSPEKPEKETGLADYPVTEETLSHLKDLRR
ncbi:MAG: right-handed parallel beta-helix repeat-containing protein [Clostridia bacterium]|nr:right-handed parallel beta-helix repeat-containing protein [Clostridia bacterium]